MTRPAVHIITDVNAWEKILSPLRHEIIETMRYLAPCSIAEIAQAIDRPADALYRHMHVLAESGFVVNAGFRKIGRRTEEIFDLVADDFRVEFGASVKSERAARASDRSPRKPAVVRSRPEKRSDPALERTVNMFLRRAGSCFQASSGAGEIQTRQPGKNFTLSYDYTWLTPERFERARAALQEYFNVLAEGRSAREGRLCCSLVLLQPVTRRKQGRASRRALPERTPAPRR